MIFGIGTDILRIDRIEATYKRFGQRFVDRLLLPEEQQLFTMSKQPVRFLAMRFAAKEAVAKALGTGMGAGISFLQITVGRLASGAPVVSLSGRAKIRSEKLEINSWHVSISDEKEFAVAFVVAENSPDNRKK